MSRYLANATLIFAATAASLSTAQAQQKPIPIGGGATFKPIIDARLRYEHVDQKATPSLRDADAVTVRIRSGAELTKGPFSLLGEAEATLAIGPNYNSTTNNKTGFAVVADPQNVELNRAQVQYKSKAVSATVGRQRINLDDQRFVGAVGWRDNEQTFDAARLEYTGIKNVKVDLTYAIGVQTIYGIDGGKFDASRPTRIDGDNVFANLSYKFKPGTLTGFAYLIEADESNVALRRTTANQTYGARFAGGMPLSGKVKLNYMASYAHQSNYARSTAPRYEADYAAAELGVAIPRLTLTGGYELLGSDRAANFAFQTPYATLHKFNGWADKFLVTPTTGLQDYYGGFAYTLPKVGGKLGPLVASFTYHRFESDRNNLHYGDEYNAQISLKLGKRSSALIKYANYDADKLLTDTKKFWLEFSYSL